MQVWAVAADVLIALLLVTVWYLGFLRYNRKKAQQLLHWICTTASGREGMVACVRWISASCFHLRLQVPGEDFREAHIKVQLLPREMPLNWLVWHWRGRQEMLTFEADLNCAPAFHLEVRNYRWSKRGAGALRPSDAVVVRTGPVVLTTRGDWQQDLTNMMNGLLASRDCNFERVEFRRRSPHFSATLPLKSLDLNCDGASQLLEALRELATGASAAMF
ncbi:MAG TPA: hypothetical protein VJQ50_18220 [Terriglobales bacterium]|nr:hypothetical protein [Terriglobales bacterium]